MRLCLDLKHEDILQTVVAENGLESIKRELLEASSKDDFQALSSKLEVQPLVKKFCGKLRNVRVFVCGRQPDLYSAGSAILNRFIVALIAQAQEVVGRQIFVYIPYEIERVQEQEKIVTFKNGQDVEEINPKHIVQRHGTASALQEYFRNIWDDCATLRTIWQKFLQGCDDTRKKHFCPEHFVPETPPNRSRLRISFGEKVGCVVITSEKASGGKVREVVHFALARATAAVFDMTGRVLDVQDVAISINEALEAPAAYDRTVRALCEAEIVVFDVTGYEPGVMLLLGIRSVARRGVTLTLTGDRLDAEMWSKMPFNLKEIYPIPYGPEEHDPAGVVVKAMLDGLSLLHTLPNRYLDLPAFDAVREYARPLTTHRDQTTGQHTLLLCSFDKDYLEGPGRTLQNSLGTLEHHRKLGKPVRIVDVVSPRLVSQKLYAEIRQAPVCVVDWTEWKSNVFYELGVRVAASDLGAVCVINPDYLNKEAIQPPKQLKQHKQLQQLFDPLRYRKLEEEADFKQEELFREQLCERAHNAHLLGAVVDEKSGYLRPSHTYDLLVDTIALAQEPGSAKVHELLGHMAEAMQGGEPLRQARLPVLFTENTRLSAQVRQQTLEYLIGAWYYLRERHGFKNLAKVAQSPLVAEYAALTDKLFVLLRDAPQADNKPLIAALRKALRQLPQTDRGGSHLLLEVDALRNQAKSCKACNKPDEAANLMQQAIARLRDKLNEPIEQQKSVLAWQNLLKSELADCYGSLGGILRAQRNLQAAWEAYDEGLVYEADHTSGYMNAYCQVQRLVARLEDSRHTWMAEWIPDPKKGGHLVHFGEAMTKARDEIEEQLRSMRRGDSWALADLAILSLLLNEEDKADTVWQAFERSNPSKSAYESVERTLRTLADALGANHKDSGVPDGICTALRDAADRLQRMQMSH